MGLIDVDGVIRGGVGQLVRPEGRFLAGRHPENTFTLRVASCAAAGGGREPRPRPRRARGPFSRAAVGSLENRLGGSSGGVCGVGDDRPRRGVRPKPPCAPPRNSCARLVSSTDFTSRPGSSRVCSAPRARQPRSCGRNRRRRKRGRRRRRSRVSRRTSRRIRRITWRRIP